LYRSSRAVTLLKYKHISDHFSVPKSQNRREILHSNSKILFSKHCHLNHKPKTPNNLKLYIDIESIYQFNCYCIKLYSVFTSYFAIIVTTYCLREFTVQCKLLLLIKMLSLYICHNISQCFSVSSLYLFFFIAATF